MTATLCSLILLLGAAGGEPSERDALSDAQKGALRALIDSLEKLEPSRVSPDAIRQWLDAEQQRIDDEIGGIDSEIARLRAQIEAARANQTAATSRRSAVQLAARLLGTAPAAEPVSFVGDVAPILVQNCQVCHGPKKASGRFRVDRFELLLEPGSSDEPAIVAGRPEQSRLYQLLVHADPRERMPQKADPLPDEQRELIRRWIAQGAKFDGPDKAAALTSLVPRAPHPDPPAAYRVPIPITAIAFRPDGGELAVGGYHEITLWNPANGALLRRIKNLGQRIYGLDYSSDGALLAVASGAPGQTGEVTLVDPVEGKVTKVLAATQDVVFDVAFRPDGGQLAAAAADCSIRIFDVAAGTEVRRIDNHSDWVVAVAWSPDGKRLASASRDKTAKVFDAETGQVDVRYADHNDALFGVVFSADGKHALSAGADKKVHVWILGDPGFEDKEKKKRRKRQVATLGGFGAEVFDVLVAGDRIFAASGDKTVRAFAGTDRKPVRTYEGLTAPVYAVAFCGPTKRLAAGGLDGRVRVWNADDGTEVTTFVAAPGYPATASSE